MDLEEWGGTPAWGTELGQGDGYRFNFEGMEEFLPSMLYTAIEDFDKVYCPLGKGGKARDSYQYIVASKYSKVYVNNVHIEDASFLLLIVRLISGDNHVGRMTLKYNPKMSYRGEELNQNCFARMREALGLNERSAWFVSEIFTKNQDELHFVAHIVDKENSKIYEDTNTRKNVFRQFLIENEGKKILFSSENKSSCQKIFFGTPGSGKSHRVKEHTEGKKVHRTTFHPDSDYASFVGCYKPTMRSSVQEILSFDELLQRVPEIAQEGKPISKFSIKYYRSVRKLQESKKEELRKRIQEIAGATTDGKSQYGYMNQAIACGEYLEREKLLGDSSEISYSFTPQVFTEAYVDAWTHPEEVVYLVIEEINRGNCAQIFGDLFQLLDRNSEGKSDYRIKADSDLRDYLYSQLGKEHEGIKGGELRLPPNLHILATMNTSDQSLFPMDSAFKRRWDWEYVPVDYGESLPSSGFVITLGDEAYRWVDFLKAVNERIRKATDSEDKQMGNFFIKSDIGDAEFKSKVMFYLWNEVCRDEYGTPNNFFRISQDPKATEQDAKAVEQDPKEAKQFSFNDLYQGSEEDRLEKLRGFMRYLGVSPSSSTTGDTEQKAGDSAEEA